jgi:uncharacterized protein
VSRSLLDVNVLLALLDSDHIDHARAWAWFDEQARYGWASCALTENGFVRVLSSSGYPSPVSLPIAAALLARARGGGHHEFWPCDISLLDAGVVLTSRLHGSRQITDAYLLALALAHGGRFVTFDQRVALTAVPGAGPDHVVVL